MFSANTVKKTPIEPGVNKLVLKSTKAAYSAGQHITPKVKTAKPIIAKPPAGVSANDKSLFEIY